MWWSSLRIRLRKGSAVKAGIELLDQSRNGIVDARVLKERQQLAEDGVVTILAAISTDGAMVAPPRVNLRGVVTTADARKMSLWTGAGSHLGARKPLEAALPQHR